MNPRLAVLMATAFTLMMAKRRYVKGYSLLESLLVLAVLGIFLTICVPLRKGFDNVLNLENELNKIVMRQYEAIIDSKPKVYSDYKQDVEVIFNRKGNVRQANTYYIYGKRVIVALGCGRVYVKR